MKIYCYYEPVDQTDEPLVYLWCDHWKERGFEPVVLGEMDSRKHPKLIEFESRIRLLPTLNCWAFERACYMRWLAFALQGEGIYADYDVFSRGGFVVGCIRGKGLVNFEYNLAPGFIYGPDYSAVTIVDAIMCYMPRADDLTYGRPHVSDMVVLQKTPELFSDIIGVTIPYGIKDWRAFNLIHFGNAYVPKGIKRIDLIRKVIYGT